MYKGSHSFSHFLGKGEEEKEKKKNKKKKNKKKNKNKKKKKKKKKRRKEEDNDEKIVEEQNDGYEEGKTVENAHTLMNSNV